MFIKFDPSEVYIKLSNTFKCAIVDKEDYDKIKNINWNINKPKNISYAMGYCKKTKKSITMHRQILRLKKGDKNIVDHIDMDGLNNKKNNLRLCTVSQNAMNKPPSKKIYKGIVFKKDQKRKKPYLARITIKGKLISLGYYKTEEEAANAYNKAAIKYESEFAYLNKVD